MQDFSALARERRSIRSFLPDPISEDVIKEIITDACWSPSWANTQSTLVYVLSGTVLDRLKAMLLEKALADAPIEADIEVTPPFAWPDPYKTRHVSFHRTQNAFVAEEEKKLGIPRADPPVPYPVAAAALCGAPHLLVLAAEKGVSLPYLCFDAGLFTQNIALSAYSRGLGAGIVVGVLRHGDLYHALIPDSDNLVFIMGVLLGRPDPEAPVNRFPRERAPLDERLFFLGD